MKNNLRLMLSVVLAVGLLVAVPASGRYVAEGESGNIRLVYSKTLMVRAPAEPFVDPASQQSSMPGGISYGGSASGFFSIVAGINEGWYYCYIKGGDSYGGSTEGSELKTYIHLTHGRYFLSAGSNGYEPGQTDAEGNPLNAHGLILPGENGSGGSSSIHKMCNAIESVPGSGNFNVLFNDADGSAYYDPISNAVMNNHVAYAKGSGGGTYVYSGPPGGNTAFDIGIKSLSVDAADSELTSYCAKMVSERKGEDQPCIILVYVGPDNPDKTKTTYTFNG